MCDKGLDGLAHGKRELQRTEVESAVEAIQGDLERLLNLLEQKVSSVVLYLTADHGILWKIEHNWRLLDGIKSSHSRFTSQAVPKHLQDYVVRIENNHPPYYLLRYPYLSNPIAANDSGVHGGLSYQESFVPMAVFKG